MKIKTYLVSSLSEAVEQIKKELGPEAVILSTKKQPGSDRWWQRGESKLEITAAIDYADSSEIEAAPSAAPISDTLRLVTQVTEERLLPVREEMKRIRELLARIAGEPPQPPSPQTPQAPQTPQTLKTTSGNPPGTNLFNENLIKDEITLSDKFNSRPVPQQKTEETRFSLESQVAKSRRPEVQDHADRDDPVLQVCRNLLWHRVRPKIVQEFADDLMKGDAAEVRSLRDVQEVAADWLLRRLPEAAPYTSLPEPPRIIAVVGPTGSGKTTTLVKLASHLAHEQKKSVAFITLDHFRIGAEEQLKKYASILKAPCELTVTDLQFKVALNRFSEIDVILLDTTGRSPNDREGIGQIEKTLRVEQPIWRALALPALLQEPELSKMIEQFQPIGCQSLIMTKLDESTCYGGLFNATHASGLPLAYFTTGQKVPEDFEEARKERVVDCLLNFSGHFSIPETSRHQWEFPDITLQKGESS